MSRNPYFKFFGANFRDGVKGMKPDEIGVYIVALTLIYDNDGSLPDDEAMIAARSGFDVRTWRRVRQRLLDLGKLHLDDGVLFNRRADKQIAERSGVSAVRSEAGAAGGRASGEARRATIAATSAEDRRDFSGTSPEDRREVAEIAPAKSLKNNDCGEANAHKPEAIVHSQTTAAACARDARDPHDPRFLIERCLAVAGPGLSTNRDKLAATADRIVAALRAGCDLDADILPVIARRTARARASPIASFAYFEAAWAEARATRETAHAEPRPDHPVPPGQADRGGAARTRRDAVRDRPRAGGIVGAALRRQARRERAAADGGAGDAAGPPEIIFDA